MTGNADSITTPKELGQILKDIFKQKYGITIKTRYIKTVRGLDKSWYEISSFSSNQIIPNELRKRFVELNYDKPFAELGVLNPENISYGNIELKRVSLFGGQWKKWIQEQNLTEK